MDLQTSAEQLELPGISRKPATRPWSTREVLVTAAAVVVGVLILGSALVMLLASHQAAPAQLAYDGRISSMSTAQIEALATSVGWRQPPGVFDGAGIDASARNYIATTQNICLQQLGGPGGPYWVDGTISWANVPLGLRSTCGSVLTTTGQRR